MSALAFRMVALRPTRTGCRSGWQLGAEARRHAAARRSRRSGQFLIVVTFYCQAAMEHGDIELVDQLLGWIESTAHELRQPTSVAYAKLRLASRACVARPARSRRNGWRPTPTTCASMLDRSTPRRSTPASCSPIRLHQGRLDEVVDLVERCATRSPGSRAPFAAAVRDVRRRARRPRGVPEMALDDVAADLERIRFDLGTPGCRR